MLVKILKDNSRLKLNKGDIYEAKRYALDPSKFNLIKRISDGFNPECNVYSNEVEILKNISKDELIAKIKEHYHKTVIATPFLNERIPEEGWMVRVSIGGIFDLIWFKYLLIDENGLIKEVSANEEESFDFLIGYQIDLTTFNDDVISGNYTDNNGVVKDGKFVLKKGA